MALHQCQDLYQESIKKTQHTMALGDEEKNAVIDSVGKDDNFRNLLERFQIHKIQDRLADFAEDKHLIDVLNRLLDYIERELREQYSWPGHIVKIGSCRDGSKVGRVNEMDTLYVVEKLFHAQEMENENCHELFLTEAQEVGKERCHDNVFPSKVLPKFADDLQSIVQDCKFLTEESDLRHGGFDAPRYSGVRYNGPATTVILTYKRPCDESQINLSIDVTLAFKLPSDHAVNTRVNKAIETIQNAYRGKIIEAVGVHFIPDVMHDAWLVTTAHLEAELFNGLSDKSATKQAFQVGKIIGSDLNMLTTSSSRYVETSDVGSFLELWKQGNKPERNVEFLRGKMRYAHYFLTETEAKKYREIVKPDVSINTAAVKHIVLAESLKYPQYFIQSTPSDTCELVLRTFDILKSLQSTRVPHAFIEGLHIDVFSLSKSALLSEKQAILKYTVLEECRRLHVTISNQLTEDDKHTSPIDVYQQENLNVLQSLMSLSVPALREANRTLKTQSCPETSADQDLSNLLHSVIAEAKATLNQFLEITKPKPLAEVPIKFVQSVVTAAFDMISETVIAKLPETLAQFAQDLIQTTFIEAIKSTVTNFVSLMSKNMDGPTSAAVHLFVNEFIPIIADGISSHINMMTDVSRDVVDRVVVEFGKDLCAGVNLQITEPLADIPRVLLRCTIAAGLHIVSEAVVGLIPQDLSKDAINIAIQSVIDKVMSAIDIAIQPVIDQVMSTIDIANQLVIGMSKSSLNSVFGIAKALLHAGIKQSLQSVVTQTSSRPRPNHTIESSFTGTYIASLICNQAVGRIQR